MGLVNNAPSCDFDPVADFCDGPVLKDGVGVWDVCIPKEAEYGGLDASMAALYSTTEKQKGEKKNPDRQNPNAEIL